MNAVTLTKISAQNAQSPADGPANRRENSSGVQWVKGHILAGRKPYSEIPEFRGAVALTLTTNRTGHRYWAKTVDMRRSDKKSA